MTLEMSLQATSTSLISKDLKSKQDVELRLYEVLLRIFMHMRLGLQIVR